MPQRITGTAKKRKKGRKKKKGLRKIGQEADTKTEEMKVGSQKTVEWEDSDMSVCRVGWDISMLRERRLLVSTQCFMPPYWQRAFILFKVSISLAYWRWFLGTTFKDGWLRWEVSPLPQPHFCCLEYPSAATNLVTRKQPWGWKPWAKESRDET